MVQNKSEMLKSVRKYILAHPNASYTELVLALKCDPLTTIQFYNIRAQLRRKGQLPDTGAAKPKTVAIESKPAGAVNNAKTSANSTRVEILHTVDASDFSPAILDHYKTGVLPLLQRLVPDGKNIRLVFLSDPPALEIRKLV